MCGRWATLDPELIQKQAYPVPLKGRWVSVGVSCCPVWLLFHSFLCPCFPGHRRGEQGGGTTILPGLCRCLTCLGWWPTLTSTPGPPDPVSVAVWLSPTPLLPHLPVVPLIVSLWLFIRHCRPGRGFLKGKSPSLGPRMTVVGELTLMGLTPRERGLDFSVFCGVFCFFWGGGCGVVFGVVFGF